MGIDATKLGVKLYILVAVLAGFIGILLASRNNASSPMAVDGMVLRVIAAIVIGGGNLSGGKGTIIGGLLGLCIMAILSNAIIQWGISPYWQKALLGSILLFAVLSEQINFNKFRRQG
jgi:ribose/xylose/arabinose/galactoside ABC-type transport system permease subunit